MFGRFTSKWFKSATPEPPAGASSIFDASLENPSIPLNAPGEWLSEILNGSEASYAGPLVSERTAMCCSTVYRCVAIKAGAIASLPLQVYQNTPTGRKIRPNHPLSPLLQYGPGGLYSSLSAFVWKELIGVNLMLAGNHYAVIERNDAGVVTALKPVEPRCVNVLKVDDKNVYEVRTPEGEPKRYPGSQIVHIPGLGFDGRVGLSPIQWAARQGIGLDLALAQFVGYMHRNSARQSGYLEVPKGISKEAFRRLREQFEGLYNGLAATGKTLFVDAGSKWSPMQMSLQDVQTLESRKFQVEDIARVFGVPVHMVGATDKVSSWGTGVEQMTIGFKVFGLGPELTRIEGELNRKLFSPSELSRGLFCEFDRSGLSAMDAKTQAELYASGIQNAQFTPNEVRRMRNLPDDPDPAANRLHIQSATVPLGSVNPSKSQPANPPEAV